MGKSSKVGVEVKNSTKHDIKLKNRTVLDRLQLIQSVVPVEVNLKTNDISQQSFPKPNDATTPKNNCEPINWSNHLKEVDLDDLNRAKENCYTAADRRGRCICRQDEDDIGCIPNLQMNIQLNDTTPVQKNDVAVPPTIVSRSESLH